jgi:hypothetical protein
VEVVALYFTIFITILSSGFAYYRYRSQVRKDRVDAFYGRLIAFINLSNQLINELDGRATNER